jgi:hypothetical protein
MPKSKHRRKPGGKSVKHPGMAQASRTRQEQANAALLRAPPILTAYHAEAFKIFGSDDPQSACYMADLIEEWYDEPVPLAKIVAMKDELFAAFVKPHEGSAGPVELSLFGPEPIRTVEEAETALALLVKHELVKVDGDRITIHPRFTLDA